MCRHNSSNSKMHLCPWKRKKKKKKDNRVRSAKAGKHLKDKEWDPAGMLRTASCLTWSWLHSRINSLYCWRLLPHLNPGQVSPSVMREGKWAIWHKNIPKNKTQNVFPSLLMVSLFARAAFQIASERSVPVTTCRGRATTAIWSNSAGGLETHNIRGTVQYDFHLSIKREKWPEDGH